MTLQAGSLFAGRFTIDRPLGRGGMGVVYRAHDRASERFVALKLLHAASDADALRFEREARILAGLRHPGIVSYVAHGQEGAQRFLAMEWIDGEDLACRLDRGPLPVPDALLLARRICAALASAHEAGVVHRDLKPSNLILPGGRIAEVKLLDFGIARTLGGASGLTRTGTLVGTPDYMAPEQARGEREVGPAADLFALGCVLYECLTGEAPFSGTNLAGVLMRILMDEPLPVEERRPGVPREVSDLVRCMLAKHPGARPVSAQALADALGALGAVPDAPPMPSRAPPGAPAGPLGGFAGSEQFLCSVSVAVPPGLAELPGAATLPAAEIESGQERRSLLESGLRGLGAQVSFLLDGTLVVTVQRAESAADQAGQAARAALLVKERWPEAQVAVATGRGALKGEMAVGEVVERAVALLRGESAAVRIDELSAGLLGPRFVLAAAPEGALLVSEQLDADQGRTLLGRPTPCVGREAELSALERLLARCADESEARAMLITAPPGTGKSRLRHEFLRRVAQRQEAVNVFFGRGEMMSAGCPYGVLADALRRHCGLSGGEDAAQQERRLAEAVRHHVQPAEQERVTRFLGELCGLSFPAGGDNTLRAARQAPRVMQDRIQRAFLDWLGAECGAGPVLLVLDDLHWGDALSVALVDQALRELSAAPLMVLALGRPEVRQVLPGLWQGERVQDLALRGLSRKACARLVQEVLGPEAPAAVVDRLVSGAAGNALFLEELIRAAAQGRSDARSETVLAMLQARIGLLDAGARRVLRAASLYGEGFWRGGVLSVLAGAQSAGEVEGALRLLVEAELIQPQADARLQGQTEYRFRHALMRDAAYSLLTDEDRRLGHRLAAAFLEQAGEQDPAILAEHWERGGEPARALPCYTRAAEQAFERWDLEQARLRAEQALACGASGGELGALRSIQTAICFAANQWPRALALAREATALLPPGSLRWCKTAGYQTAILALTGEEGPLHQWIEALCDAVPGPEARSAYIESVGQSLSVLSQTRWRAAARRMRERVDRLAGDPRAIDASAQGWLRLGLGGYTRALEADVWAPVTHYQEADAAFRRAGNLRDLVTAASYLGQARCELGDLAGGESTLRRNITDAQGLREPYLLVVAHLHLAAALAGRGGGEQGEAEALAREALGQPGASPGHKAWAQGILGQVLLARGLLGDAEAALQRSAEGSARAPLRRLHAQALLIRCLTRQGRHEASCALAKACLAEAGSLGGAGYVEVTLRVAVAEALDGAGERAGAAAALEEALRQIALRAGGIPEGPARERYLTGVCDVVRAQELAKR